MSTDYWSTLRTDSPRGLEHKVCTLMANANISARQTCVDLRRYGTRESPLWSGGPQGLSTYANRLAIPNDCNCDISFAFLVLVSLTSGDLNVMKTSFVTVLATLFLASLVWLFFSRMTPDAPLSRKEMVFIVVCCFLLVVLLQSIWKRLRKERTK